MSPPPPTPLLLALAALAAPAAARAACGDGAHDADEACDDGGRVADDGCDARCQVEPGWTCTSASLGEAFVEVLLDEREIRGGFHRPPRWVSASSAEQVRQEDNARASIYGTGVPLAEVTLTMDLRVEREGDDFIGLTVGYTPGERSSAEADWMLLDWKRADYRSPGCRGAAGLALSRVRGPLAALDDLWCHAGAVSELARANTLGSQGWAPGRTYRVRLEYARSQVRVYVDGALEIAVDGVFPEGELGLYAFSQEGATWSLVSPRDRSVCAGLDSDQDGLADATEMQLQLDPRRPDSDGDGVPDRREVGDRKNPLDTDQDGMPNARDADDDGDGVPTARESWDGDRDPTNDDTDRDGLPDYLDGDDDGDGLPTATERGDAASAAERDADGDGRPDRVDLDDDGDGVLTATERGPSAAPPPDRDQDGVPDHQDADDDGDRIPTASESYDGDRDPANDDTDRDGVPDYLDPDDDGDGLPTAEETADSAGSRDIDFDGRPDHIDLRLDLPEGVSAAAPEVVDTPAPPPEEAPSAAEQVGAALEEGLAAVQEAAAPQAGSACGCAGAGAASSLAGLLGVLGALLSRRARGGRP